MEVFKDYAKKVKEPVWSPFLNMLNRPDGFIVNQVRESNRPYSLSRQCIWASFEHSNPQKSLVRTPKFYYE